MVVIPWCNTTQHKLVLLLLVRSQTEYLVSMSVKDNATVLNSDRTGTRFGSTIFQSIKLRILFSKNKISIGLIFQRILKDFFMLKKFSDIQSRFL
jgi:hypothetical protein